LSTGVRLGLQSSVDGDSLFTSEEELRTHAHQNKWFHHNFK
jgi:hypothetical protein